MRQQPHIGIQQCLWWHDDLQNLVSLDLPLRSSMAASIMKAQSLDTIPVQRQLRISISYSF